VKNAENQPLTVHVALQNNKALESRKTEETLAWDLVQADFLQKDGNRSKAFAGKPAGTVRYAVHKPAIICQVAANRREVTRKYWLISF
jgi:hypothetical protein